MIKRLNSYILSKIMGIRLRSIGAVVLGGFAGVSLTTTILPAVIATLGVTDSFSARIDLAGFAVYSFMSLGCRRLGGPANGQDASGRSRPRVGRSSQRGHLCLHCLRRHDGTAATCAAAGLAYGTVGGMLIAAALRRNDHPTAD